MTTSRFILGVTPSALALYDVQNPNGSCVWDMPTDDQGIIPGRLVRILEEMLFDLSNPRIHVRAVIADQQGGQFDRGIICGELASFAIPYTFSQLESRDEAQERARWRFPDMANLFNVEARAAALMLAVQSHQRSEA